MCTDVFAIFVSRIFQIVYECSLYMNLFLQQILIIITIIICQPLTPSSHWCLKPTAQLTHQQQTLNAVGGRSTAVMGDQRETGFFLAVHFCFITAIYGRFLDLNYSVKLVLTDRYA